MFVIRASTPEVMKNEIVKWLNSQANNCSTAGRIAVKKTTQKDQKLKAETMRLLLGFQIVVQLRGDEMENLWFAAEIAKGITIFVSLYIVWASLNILFG